MTEPIIINGVDVSECDNYTHKTEKCCDVGLACVIRPNCYYKQLKRKEQELSEIKNDIETRTFCVTCKKENENDKLKVECEKYKKFVETIKSRIKGYKESCDEFCQYNRKCCHSCFTGGAIELGEDIEMDINEVENER